MVNRTRPTPVERVALGLSPATSEELEREGREQRRALLRAEEEAERLYREGGIVVDPWLLTDR